MVSKVVIAIVVAIGVMIVRKVLNWAWLKPKKLEKWLRDEGYKGNSYKVVVGDMEELSTMMMEAKSKAMPITHDITSHVLPFDHHIISKYGKRSFMWFGPTPRIYITDPELIKEILWRPNEFQKPHPEPIRDSIIAGLLASEGRKWTKHRQIINPAFHLQNIKSMFSSISLSCRDMNDKWQLLTAETGVMEVDVWPFIDNLAGDIISRTAFGSCYEEGRKIFRIQKEQTYLVIQRLLMLYLPGGRFIPTKANKKFKENDNKLKVMLRTIIDKRKKAIDIGEHGDNDLLGILLESNSKEIEEDGIGMSMEDVIEECKLFYLAGSETTSNLIVWTMVCLSLHQEWQIRARQEVQQVFGTEELNFDGLKHLKIVTMILNEVLRLYPPAVMVTRATSKETKLGNMMIPSGVHITIPIIYVHHDREIWGEDATEFKPERFSEGVANATKTGGPSAFLPFTSGPRVCIGQNFAMIEAKTAIAKILQRFSFQLSPSYTHSPFPVFTLPPRFGAHLILRSI
ncbi:cytochrome P450 CYP72A219-like [Cynara cardunculus var. scolymus]|uniref:cytochrome P450 CYP72A219-like n=1 Tax=Cynara cardunculus var. scolymus TaxID=59895 RepID=UPI000D62B1C2|nr:cytochrome P450 CYP72A219-like [Cynara cardunculus var. scolymus]